MRAVVAGGVLACGLASMGVAVVLAFVGIEVDTTPGYWWLTGSLFIGGATLTGGAMNAGVWNRL